MKDEGYDLLLLDTPSTEEVRDVKMFANEKEEEEEGGDDDDDEEEEDPSPPDPSSNDMSTTGIPLNSERRNFLNVRR